MKIYTLKREIEVSDEQHARLDETYTIYNETFQGQPGMETKVLFQEAEARMLDEANDLLTEQGDSNPEYDRALVELCSRVLGLSDNDDRDLVTLLVKGNEVMAGAAWQNRVGPYDAAIDEYGPDENIEGSEA